MKVRLFESAEGEVIGFGWTRDCGVGDAMGIMVGSPEGTNPAPMSEATWSIRPFWGTMGANSCTILGGEEINVGTG